MLVPSYSSADLRDKYAKDLGYSETPPDPRDVAPEPTPADSGPQPAVAAPPEIPGDVPEDRNLRNAALEACNLLLDMMKKMNYFCQEIAYYINAVQNKMNQGMSAVQNFSVGVPDFPKTPKFADTFKDISAACPFIISVLPKDNLANWIDSTLKTLTTSMEADLNSLLDEARNSKAFKRLTNAVDRINKGANVLKAQIYGLIQVMEAIVKCLQAICDAIESSPFLEHINKWKEWAVGTTEGGLKDSFMGKWASEYQNQNAAKLNAFKQFAKPIPKWKSPEPKVYPGIGA